MGSMAFFKLLGTSHLIKQPSLSFSNVSSSVNTTASRSSAKKIGKAASEAIEYIFKRCNAGTVRIVFKLRNITFGKVAPVRKFFLRKLIFKPELSYFNAYFHTVSAV